MWVQPSTWSRKGAPSRPTRKEAAKTYVEQQDTVKQAKATLALLMAPTSKGKKTSKEIFQESFWEDFTEDQERRGFGQCTSPRTARKVSGWLWKSQVRHRDHQEQVRSHCYQDVSVLCKFAVCGCQVRMEQDKHGADGDRSVQRFSRRVQERPKGTFTGVIWWLHYVSPSHCVSKQRSWARKILPFQHAQEAPEGWRTSVWTARRAAQCLRLAVALLVLQPKLQCRYDTGKCSIHQDWSGLSHSLDVSTTVAGSVQPARKRDDSRGHAFSSSFFQGCWARVSPEKAHVQSGKKLLRRVRVAQYWSYKAGSQESPFQEVLRTMQETLGRAYHACYQGLLQVRERRNGECQFLRC